MITLTIEEAGSLAELRALKTRIIAAKKAVTEHGVDLIKEATKDLFSKGMPGFHPRPGGEMLTKGLRITKVRKKKSRAFATLWHPLLNLFENFKKRKQVKLVSAIGKELRARGIKERLTAELIRRSEG